MITNKGKDILAKYLIGQAPAYASHIAIGCGAKPLDTVDDFPDSSANTELNLEMFRVPIISRGYVNEGGTPKIVFTAELPTEERYQISEIGIYSAAANPSATGNDSRTIFAFSNRENWEQHGASTVTAIPRYDGDLSKPGIDAGDMIDTAAAEDVFQTISNNPFFTINDRAIRNENCRFLNNIIALKGNESNLTKSTIDGKQRLVIGSESKHIHLNAIGINLEKNAPNDLLKLAFAVVNKNLDGTQPDEVRIMVEFTPSDASSEYARFDVILTNGSTYTNAEGSESFVYPSGTTSFANNRYYVVAREIQELQKSSGFSWNEVNTIKIYSTVIKSGSRSSDYFICLDALRLDNVATENPIYGLTGYTPVVTTNAQPILKDTNTKNFVEFRFAIGIDGTGITS
jgi:hypothetical protein